MKNIGNPNSRIVCERRNPRLVRRTTGPGESGQALLELALVLPFLILLLIGALEFGIISYAAIEVSNAAEAGALYGSQNRANAANTAGMILTAQNDASNLVTVTANATTSCSCQSTTGTYTPATPGTCSPPPSCASPSQVVEWVTVTTSSTIDPAFHYPTAGIPTTITLHGQATMRVAPR